MISTVRTLGREVTAAAKSPTFALRAKMGHPQNRVSTAGFEMLMWDCAEFADG